MTILDIIRQEAIEAGCDGNTLRIEHINQYNLKAYAVNIATGKEEITSGWITHPGDINAEPNKVSPRKVSAKKQ